MALDLSTLDVFSYRSQTGSYKSALWSSLTARLQLQRTRQVFAVIPARAPLHMRTADKTHFAHIKTAENGDGRDADSWHSLQSLHLKFMLACMRSMNAG